MTTSRRFPLIAPHLFPYPTSARRCPRPRLLLFFAAVGEEFAAGDEAALVGGEKQDGVGDLVGAGDSSQRQSATQLSDESVGLGCVAGGR